MLVQVFEKNRLLVEQQIDEPFYVGRQQASEPDPYAFIPFEREGSKVRQKLIIASAEERTYSRDFAEVHFDDKTVQLRNVSRVSEIHLPSGQPIVAGESRKLFLPGECGLGQRTIKFKSTSVEASVDDDESYFALSQAPSIPLQHTALDPSNVTLLKVPTDSADFDSERLLDWLRAMLTIFQGSAGSQAYYDGAAKALMKLLELDHCIIAFREHYGPEFHSSTERRWFGEWRTQAFLFHGRDDDEWLPSRQTLEMVVNEKKTIYQVPDLKTESLVAVNNLVASPLLDIAGTVIGVVYGDRGINPAIEREGFSKTEAMFVELFASSISTGYARLVQADELAEMRSRFDQFFTPELARKLEDDPELLEGRAADVSVLFCDIRGFSRIAERIGPEKTILWINSVMGVLSNCVLDQQGVVVDYIGDELMAMWGAPAAQENHAELAVRAAVSMFSVLPAINEEWSEQIGEPFDIGIGINSGTAQVGNTGSQKKFKYGPLGHAVNIGSRLQGATKQLRTRLLVTEATNSQLPPEFHRRKIRRVQFVNVEEPVDVFEVQPVPSQEWQQLKTEYEASLELFEHSNLLPACKQLAAIVNSFPDDGPGMLLLSHAVEALTKEGKAFDPVWVLDSK